MRRDGEEPDGGCDVSDGSGQGLSAVSRRSASPPLPPPPSRPPLATASVSSCVVEGRKGVRRSLWWRQRSLMFPLSVRCFQSSLRSPIRFENFCAMDGIASPIVARTCRTPSLPPCPTTLVLYAQREEEEEGRVLWIGMAAIRSALVMLGRHTCGSSAAASMGGGRGLEDHRAFGPSASSLPLLRPSTRNLEAGKLIANLIIMGSGIIGRAMLQAYRKALHNDFLWEPAEQSKACRSRIESKVQDCLSKC